MAEQLLGLDHLHDRRWDQLFPRWVAGFDFVQDVRGVGRQVAGVVVRDGLDEFVFPQVGEQVAVEAELLCTMRTIA